MLLRRLVQNYYEVHGSFTDIQLTFFGDELMNAATSVGYSLEDMCYSYLGYSDTDKLKPSELCSLRKKILTHCDYEGRAYDINTVKSIMSDYNPDCYKPNRATYNEHEQIVFDMCYAYYKDCYDGYVELSGHIVRFTDILDYLHTSVSNVDKVFKGMQKADSALSFVYSDKGNPQIVDNVLYGPFALKVPFEDIAKQALHCILFGLSADLSKYAEFFNAQHGALSLTNPAIYLELIDIANAIGCTYKELLAEVGLEVLDQRDIFERYGYVILYKESDDIIIALDRKSTANDLFKRKVVY